MESSNECEQHIKGFSGAVHQSFSTKNLAERWLRELLAADVEVENIRLSKLYPSSSQSTNDNVRSEESESEVEIEGYKNSILLNYPSLDKLISPLQPQCSGSLPIVPEEEPIYISSSPPPAPDDTQVPFQEVNELDDEDNRPPSIDLSPEQERVLNLVLEGKNVFFTGPAGSGKTLVLQHIRYRLNALGKGFAVTAPTGVAAELIKGVTINSWSGVGKGDKGVLEYLGRARGRQAISLTAVVSWRNVEVLIVDEVSMVGHCSARGAEKGLIVG